MPGKAAKVVITERQKDTLEHLVRSSTTTQGLVQRCRIILFAFEGRSNEDIAPLVGLGRHQVGVWRQRWRDQWQALILEEFSSPEHLEKAIARLLADEHRPGSPGKFTATQVALIQAMACEPPADSGRPITHWTARELAGEAQKRGVVDSISTRQAGRFLKDGRPETASCGGLAHLEA